MIKELNQAVQAKKKPQEEPYLPNTFMPFLNPILELFTIILGT